MPILDGTPPTPNPPRRGEDRLLSEPTDILGRSTEEQPQDARRRHESKIDSAEQGTMKLEADPKGTVSSFIGIENVPGVVRNLSPFAHPNFIDCHVMDTPYASGCAPEVWARAILEESSLSRDARVLWTLMGLRLGPPHSSDHVQGWRIESHGDRWLRLETSSWYLRASVIFLTEPDRVMASLSLRYDWSVARFIWAVVSDRHQKAVPVMMRQADRLLLQ